MASGAFLGTSEFAATVLDRLAGSAHAPALVVTPPDRRRGRGRRELPSPVAERAQELGIEVLKTADVNSADSRLRLARLGSGFSSTCAFGQLIREPLLTDLPMLNVHPSLLPRWRGAAPIERAIMSGDELTGVSIMRLVAGLDSGPVALRREVGVGDADDFGSLAARLAGLGGELLVEALSLAREDRVEWVEQDDEAATYAEKIEPSERRLDPDRTADELARTVRALNPHIGAHLMLEGEQRLGVRKAAAVEVELETAAMEVLPAGGEGGGEPELLLGCRRGSLRLEVVQAPGGRPLAAADFLRGHSPPARALTT